MSPLLSGLMTGLAFFLVIEGLLYALAPRLVKAMARLVPEMPEEQLRVMGIVVLALGVGLAWLVHG